MSATSAVRPLIGNETRRSRIIRATSATAIGAMATQRERDQDLAPRHEPDRRQTRTSPRMSGLPPCPRGSARRSKLEPALDRGSDRCGRGMSPTGQPARPSAAWSPVDWHASTTMYAKEIGRPSRYGGRSSSNSPAAIAPPISASAVHGVPGCDDLCTQRDDRASAEEQQRARPAIHRPGRLLLCDQVAEPRRTSSGLGRCDSPVVLIDLVAVAVGLAAPLDRTDECVDALSVELRTRSLAKFRERGLLGQSTPVRACRRHRVERVRHVDDRRLDQLGDPLHRSGRGFGGRVTSDRRQEVDTSEQLDRHGFVSLHPLELGLGQTARLVEQLVRNDELPDVVHQGRVAKSLHPARTKPEFFTDVPENIATRRA